MRSKLVTPSSISSKLRQPRSKFLIFRDLKLVQFLNISETSADLCVVKPLKSKSTKLLQSANIRSKVMKFLRLILKLDRFTSTRLRAPSNIQDMSSTWLTSKPDKSTCVRFTHSANMLLIDTTLEVLNFEFLDAPKLILVRLLQP